MKPKILHALALAATTARPATVDWTNTLGGDWSQAQNWTPNIVPGAADSADITQPGTYTVTIATGPVSVVNLSLGWPSGTQTLIQGSFTALLRFRQRGVKCLTRLLHNFDMTRPAFLSVCSL
jgi:hypothetical protein